MGANETMFTSMYFEILGFSTFKFAIISPKKTFLKPCRRAAGEYHRRKKCDKVFKSNTTKNPHIERQSDPIAALV